jgi:hypothetical protein
MLKKPRPILFGICNSDYGHLFGSVLLRLVVFHSRSNWPLAMKSLRDPFGGAKTNWSALAILSESGLPPSDTNYLD